MSHATDENGRASDAPAPRDDFLLVRPYVSAPGVPSGPTAPLWPQSGPAAAAPDTPPAAADTLPPASPAVPGRARRKRAAAAGRARPQGGRRPLLVLAALLLGAACGLPWLLSGPEPDPGGERAAAPPGLTVPALPQRNPGAGEPEPVGTPSASAATAVPRGTPTASPSAGGSSGTPSPPSPSATRSAKARTSDTLRRGDSGPEVRALQERLYGQGFTYVTLTGIYDDQTWRGVTQLQRDRGIKGDPQGVYGPATRAALEG